MMSTIRLNLWRSPQLRGSFIGIHSFLSRAYRDRDSLYHILPSALIWARRSRIPPIVFIFFYESYPSCLPPMARNFTQPTLPLEPHPLYQADLGWQCRDSCPVEDGAFTLGSRDCAVAQRKVRKVRSTTYDSYPPHPTSQHYDIPSRPGGDYTTCLIGSVTRTTLHRHPR